MYRSIRREASRVWSSFTTRILLLGLSLSIAGCDAPRGTSEEPIAPASPKPTSFDPASARSISGRVIWNGAVPKLPLFDVMPNPLSGVVLQKRQQRPNPNLPIIDQNSRALAGAIVFLRGVDPTRARPWNLPPVCVEQRDCQVKILQGDTTSQIGFVHQGDEIEMVSRDPWLHALHVDGTSFFTLMFPDPAQPLRRRLNTPGAIELSSNAGYFWMRGYLFVSDHPYYCRTDREGRFELAGIPPGTYRLAAWHPNWQIARKELDQESGLPARISFARPFETEISITLTDRDQTELLLTIDGPGDLPPSRRN